MWPKDYFYRTRAYQRIKIYQLWKKYPVFDLKKIIKELVVKYLSSDTKKVLQLTLNKHKCYTRIPVLSTSEYIMHYLREINCPCIYWTKTSLLKTKRRVIASRESSPWSHAKTFGISHIALNFSRFKAVTKLRSHLLTGSVFKKIINSKYNSNNLSQQSILLSANNRSVNKIRFVVMCFIVALMCLV